ncbi:winged helix-turn-helix domain-containing protein [Kitasatospora viridis]|uniref:Helix-turn-helix protein n=1 Tax=Kitasatospora viridis TaxID=281105 RepID=A0A561UG50_9ACTN|nr:winged helix-turn-helix domain-containing protein [Kitasatospora viridis]TWF98342.1 helix-turn-helix protein [Kitasatospora viridis]
MLRIELSADDLARVRFAARPAPLVELKLALMMLQRPDSAALFGRWRHGLRRRLPDTTRPLWDLLTPYRGPAFLDPVSTDLATGLHEVRTAPPALVRDGIERVWADRRSTPPSWLHDLADGRATAHQLLHRSLRDAYDTVLRESWPEIRSLHQAEYLRYALTAAEHGVAAALTALCPGSRLVDGTWELDAPHHRHLVAAGRGLTLLPTFHWTATPLLGAVPGQPTLLVYPAGPGIPVTPAATDHDPLAPVLGTTRARALRLLADPMTTTDLAHRLGISPGSASTHATALREAGLIATARDGRAVHHTRTALGTALAL